MLEELIIPRQRIETSVLKLHSAGALGKTEEAQAIYENLMAERPLIDNELIEELHRRYILKETPLHDEDWIFMRESEMLLIAAVQHETTPQTILINAEVTSLERPYDARLSLNFTPKSILPLAA